MSLIPRTYQDILKPTVELDVNRVSKAGIYLIRSNLHPSMPEGVTGGILVVSPPFQENIMQQLFNINGIYRQDDVGGGWKRVKEPEGMLILDKSDLDEIHHSGLYWLNKTGLHKGLPYSYEEGLLRVYSSNFHRYTEQVLIHPGAFVNKRFHFSVWCGWTLDTPPFVVN